jgi:hypothetical protein
MAASPLAWAFNNPKMSDIQVVLTTGSASEYRARVPHVGTEASTNQRTRQRRSDRTQTSEERPACDKPAVEELYGHKVILSSHSEFFKAAVEWRDSNCGAEPSTGGSNKRGREEPEVAVLSLSDAHQFGTAKLMIRFMYTQQLPDSIDRSEVMRLMQMADEFSVPDLRRACMAHLAATPLKQWSADERQLLSSCWASVDNDVLAADVRLAAAASLLAASFASHFTELEVALSDDANWALMCSLPHAVVLAILRNDDLVVRSENTALVAALSWLRTAGKDASEAARKDVMACVRLLQLSPWFLSWFVLEAPEARTLLAPVRLSTLVHYMATMQDDSREELRDGNTWLGALSKARSGESADLKVSVELCVDGSAVRRGVRECAAGWPDAEATWIGRATFFNGVMWRACATVHPEVKEGGEAGDAGELPTVAVDAGLACSLQIGSGSKVKPVGMPFDFWLTCTPALRKTRCHDASFADSHCYFASLAHIKAGTDQKAALQPLLDGGRLVVKCDVLF